MAGSENQESLMPAQCVKLASLFYFEIKIKGGKTWNLS